MRKLILLIAICQVYTITRAQTNAEIIGKTVTDSIQIINGASMGHILQSADGMGLGKWVSPTVLGDNLGDHTATTKIKMDGNLIEGLDSIKFKNGQIIDQATPGILKYNSHLDLQCNNLDNVRMINFCPTGSPFPVTSFTVFPPFGVGLPDEMVLMNGAPAPPTTVSLGIGGPVNPPIAPLLANVIANAGVIPGPAPYFNLGVYGDAWAINWWALSDARFKKDIASFEGALSKISKLKPVTYEFDQEAFRERNFPKGKTYGFLAQDLLEVAPELVRMGSDGYFMVQYNGLLPILTEGIQELDERVDLQDHKLRDEIAVLKRENEVLQKRLEKLEKLILE